MFCRRSTRRALRPPRDRIRSGRRAPQALILANQMIESGNYAVAAEQFENIARIAEMGGGRHLPQIYLQAGRACILAGDTEAGLSHLKRGLSLFVNRGEWLHLHTAGNLVVAELNQQGLTKEANEILRSLKTNLPGNFSAPQTVTQTRKPVLPTHCPSCGGAIRTDEIDWLDEITAECAFCGSPVREEK